MGANLDKLPGLADDREPWEQQLPWETEIQFELFGIYLNCGTARTLGQVAKRRGTSVQYIKDLAAVRLWSERARAWDAQEKAEYDRQMASFRRRAAMDHYATGSKLLAKAAERLEQLDPDTLTPSEVVRMAEVGAKLQLLAVGMEPTQVNVTGRVEHMVAAETVRGLSHDERRERLRVITGELLRRGGNPADTLLEIESTEEGCGPITALG